MADHQLLIVSQHAERFSELIAAAQLPDLSFRGSSDPVNADCRGVEILFGAPDQLVALLARCDSLRWVQSSWAGIKPLIDHPRRDYQLTGVKDIFSSDMTEYVLAWLLALERRVVERSQTRHWDANADGHLRGKTLGIMGTGSIGCHLAAACQALGLRVRGLNSDGRRIPNFDQCYAPTRISEFTDDLDYLVTLLPDTPGSDGLVDGKMLGLLKPGAILINAGRANVIDREALLNALQTGQLGHAVLDVLEQEPLPESDPLWQVKNLHITSHTAAVTIPEAIVEVFCDNYRRYNAGQALLHQVDFDRGY